MHGLRQSATWRQADRTDLSFFHPVYREMELRPPPAVQFKLPGAEEPTETPPPWSPEGAGRHGKMTPAVQYYGSISECGRPGPARTRHHRGKYFDRSINAEIL